MYSKNMREKYGFVTACMGPYGKCCLFAVMEANAKMLRKTLMMF